MLHFDFYANPPANLEILGLLKDFEYPLLSPILPAQSRIFERHIEEISAKFHNKEIYLVPLNASFMGDLVNHCDYYLLSSNYETYLASKIKNFDTKKKLNLDQNFCTILPSSLSGTTILTSSINEDIFSHNDLNAIQKTKDANFILDVSFSVLAGDFSFIDLENASFIISARALKIPLPFMVFIASRNLKTEIKTLLNINAIRAVNLALVTSKALKVALNQRIKIEIENKILLEMINLQTAKFGLSTKSFVDFKLLNTKAQPRRLEGIKARSIMQDLGLKDYILVNGKDCLYGYFRPSFVLMDAGFSEDISRELISISYENLEEKEALKFAKNIASTYAKVLSLGL